jgi:hypothetical protein
MARTGRGAIQDSLEQPPRAWSALLESLPKSRGHSADAGDRRLVVDVSDTLMTCLRDSSL